MKYLSFLLALALSHIVCAQVVSSSPMFCFDDANIGLEDAFKVILKVMFI